MDSLFNHHVYEYKKGIRKLVLHTANKSNLSYIKNKLKDDNIDYIVNKINNNKYNIFFGDKDYLVAVKNLKTYDVSKLTSEEDFILGILLGYDRLQQCERYFKNKNQGGKDE